MVVSRMPSFYIPVEPDGNGIGIPLLLSILIHAAIIGFVFFTHRVPHIDVAKSIETSIVTPEELATMQAGIRANRASAQLGTQIQQSSQVNQADDTKNINSQPSDTSTPNLSIPQDSQLNRHSVPVFISSNDDVTQSTQQIDIRLDPTDIKSLDYEKRQQIFNEKMQQEATQSIQSYANEIAEKNEKEKQLVNELKSKKPIIEKPKRVEKSFAPSTDDINSNSNISTWSLGDDGDPLLPGSNAGTRGRQGSAGSQGGGGSIDGALISHIEPYWHPPKNRVGESVVADVTVDANGNVLSIKIDSADNELKSSLDSAIRNASPLIPIQGTDKRKLRLHFVVK